MNFSFYERHFYRVLYRLLFGPKTKKQIKPKKKKKIETGMKSSQVIKSHSVSPREVPGSLGKLETKEAMHALELPQSLRVRSFVLHVTSPLSWKTGMRSRMKPQ